MSTKAKSDKSGTMKWWKLSLLGVACTIGTGYFLGSGIGIKMGGGSVIIMFILAALGTYIVFDVLARMTEADPQQGSFRAYAKKAFGLVTLGMRFKWNKNAHEASYKAMKLPNPKHDNREGAT